MINLSLASDCHLKVGYLFVFYCDKHHGQMQFGEEKGLFHLSVTILHEGEAGQEVEAGTSMQEPGAGN